MSKIDILLELVQGNRFEELETFLEQNKDEIHLEKEPQGNPPMIFRCVKETEVQNKSEISENISVSESRKNSQTNESQTHIADVHVHNNDTVDAATDSKTMTMTQSLDNKDVNNFNGGLIDQSKFLQTVKTLVKYGMSLDRQDENGKTALHWAVYHRDVQLIKEFIKLGASPLIDDGKGQNVLHFALRIGADDVLETIIEHSPNEILDTQNKNGSQPLIYAVQLGNYDACRTLVELGANCDVQEYETHRTPIQYALYNKRLDIFSLLLKYKARVDLLDCKEKCVLHRTCLIPEGEYLREILIYNRADEMAEVKNDEGATPLMIACQGGNVDQVNTLLEEKTSLLDIDSTGKTCLHYCVENKDTTVAEILLEADTDHKLLQIQDEEGYNAAHMCVIAGNSDLLKVLLKEGTEIECTDKEQHTAVHWATVCGQEEIIDILCEYDAELSKPDIHHAYPLHYTAQMCGEEEGNDPVTGLAILKKLLSKDITINVEDSDQRQPLLWAASAGSGDACAALVDSGADVNAADKDGLNALHCAASRGHTACVEALVKTCKAAIDCDDKNGCTSLFYAITMDHLETAKVLLELGASPNHRDKKGRSPAHCAASKGNQSGISLISEKGGDIWLKNSKGELPLHEASQAGHKALVTQIMSDEKQREKMLDNLNSSNSDGRTCLHLAAMTNNLELCKLFLDNGANVNALMFYKNKYLTPYDTAVVKGHKECAEYLKSHGAAAGVKVANHNASKIQRQFRKNQKKEEPPEEPPKTPEDEKSVIETEPNEEENVNVILENEKDSEDEKEEEEEEAEKEEEVEEDNVEDDEEDKDIDETTPRQKKKRTKSGNQDSPLARSVRNSVKIYEQTRSTIQSLQRLKRMQIYLGGQLTETMLVRKFRESEKQLRKLATEEHDITSSNQWEQYLLDQISFLTKVSHSDHPEFRSVKAMAKEREEEERKRAEQEFEDHQQRNDHMYNDLNTRTNMRLSQAKATNSQIEETLQKSRLERRKKNQGDMSYGKQQKRLAKAYCPGEPTEVLDDIFKSGQPLLRCSLDSAISHISRDKPHPPITKHDKKLPPIKINKSRKSPSISVHNPNALSSLFMKSYMLRLRPHSDPTYYKRPLNPYRCLPKITKSHES